MSLIELLLKSIEKVSTIVFTAIVIGFFIFYGAFHIFIHLLKILVIPKCVLKLLKEQKICYIMMLLLLQEKLGELLFLLQLLKQQQLNIHQRLYLSWLQKVTVEWNEWSERACWVVKQQTLTTLDNSKTGTIETVAGEKS